MLKYYLCLLYVFDIRVTCRKCFVFALFIFTSLTSGLCYMLTADADICFFIPNLGILLIAFMLRKGTRLKGLLTGKITFAEALDITVSQENKDLCTAENPTVAALTTAITGITTSINAKTTEEINNTTFI